MSKCSDTVKNAEDRTNQHKSLTPAVLGIPSGPHGAKLPSNMNLKDKEELLLKLEAWRQARKEKLTATILAKGKLSSCSKLTPILPGPKIRTKSNPPVGTDLKQNSSDGKKNVFDRLYENANRIATKKPEDKSEKCNIMKNLPSVKPKCPQFGKHKVPKVILFSNSVNSSGPTDETYKETTIAVSGMEPLSDKEDGIESEKDDFKNLAKEVYAESNLMHEEEISQIKEEVNGKNHDSDNNSNELPLETDLSTSKREESDEQNEQCDSSDNNNVKVPLQETTLPINVEEKIREMVDEVGANGNEFKKDDGNVSFEVKKGVCFETPREKILSAVHLRNQLQDWLSQKGHSIDAYKHLRYFGLNAGKTTISHHLQIKTDVSNSSFYYTAPNTPVSEVIDESDKENVTPMVSAPEVDIKDVEGWLGDLYRLVVHIEYPSDRCEEWLNAITKKFPSCTQLPLYWECLAAVNGVGDHLKETEEIEQCENKEGVDHETLKAEMFDKLAIDEKCHSASKTERGLSMKNIFKSKTVKFALQEKSVKEVDPELGTEARRKVLVATPVRRSARLQTPDKSNIIGSLQSLDPETRRSVSFQPNEALLTG